MAEKTQVELYSLKELDKIRRACDVVVEVLETVAEYVKPGVSTAELDLIAREEVKKKKKKEGQDRPFSTIDLPLVKFLTQPLCAFL
jgi:methionyl aminopeptidase